MKIIPFPKPGDERDERIVAAQIDAALHGESRGEAADHWRELRADVRSLAPPISPEFEQQLRERIRGSQIGQRHSDPRRDARKRLTPRAALVRSQTWLGSGLGPRLISLAGVCALAAVIALAIAAPWRAPESSSSSAVAKGSVDAVVPADRPGKSQAKTNSSAAASGEAPSAAFPSTAVASPARVQQRAASITLAPKPQGVQSVADQVAQLAARDGGFVQSLQVHLQHGAGGEANLQLSLPSARLSAALAELAQLAPTRAQSQSLQDITDVDGAARTKLADAVAARSALLRALSKASTQGQIESLRARLSLAGGAIVQVRAAFQSVATRANNSAVEVTVLGDTHADAGQSTLSNALHDAGGVLKVALAALIVALAVLVPLALLGVLAAVAWRSSRRRLRERALS
jgi:HAMP domain-containing protein